MAKVILQSIGKPRESFLPDEIWEHQKGDMQRLLDRLHAERAGIAQGWGEKYRDRVHAKRKLTTLERVESLKDPDSPLLPIGTFVNHGREFGGRSSPRPGS